MKAITSILLLVSISISSSALASEDYADTPEKFINMVAAKKFEEAIGELYSGKKFWSTPQGLAEKANIATKLKELGDYRFHKLLSEKNINNRYVTLSYLIGFQEQPLFATIVMYKPEDSWKTWEFNFGQNPYDIKNFSLK